MKESGPMYLGIPVALRSRAEKLCQGTRWVLFEPQPPDSESVVFINPDATVVEARQLFQAIMEGESLPA